MPIFFYYNFDYNQAKFSLILHKTGRYRKKIKGKPYYFGADKQQALEQYLQQAESLHTGRKQKHISAGNSITIKIAAILYK